ncbi:helix-turn-helix transcriptional regulator, partial [Salmonella enterica]|uniref:helix-turn-helix transcriptional regulator n=1 Tax=Salmonella enterica TaxID=28901 RepID=UPI001115C0BC
MTVAEKIKTYRLRKACSQEQLAEVASLSVRTVQRTEKGQKPSLETLSAIASAFGVISRKRLTLPARLLTYRKLKPLDRKST